MTPCKISRWMVHGSTSCAGMGDEQRDDDADRRAQADGYSSARIGAAAALTIVLTEAVDEGQGVDETHHADTNFSRPQRYSGARSSLAVGFGHRHERDGRALTSTGKVILHFLTLIEQGTKDQSNYRFGEPLAGLWLLNAFGCESLFMCVPS